MNPDPSNEALNSSQFQLPSYLLKTSYGEELQKRLSSPKKDKPDSSIATKLSTLGILGSMPSRCMNEEYHNGLVAMLRGTQQNAHSTERDDNDDIGNSHESAIGLQETSDFSNDEMDIDVEADADIDDEDGATSVASLWREPSKRISSKLYVSLNAGSLASSLKYSLPTKWEKASSSSLIVSNRGLNLTIDNSSQSTSSISKNYDHLVTKADNLIPANVGVFYFEVTILPTNNTSTKNNSEVIIGFMHSEMENVTKMPGMEIGSYGFNGNTGCISCNQSVTKKYNCAFGWNDVIGCGVNLSTKSIFYTKNGIYLGIAFKDIDQSLIPIIGLKSGNAISTNFGQDEFIFDIDGYINDQKLKIYHKLLNSTKSNEPDSPSIEKVNKYTDREIPTLLQKLVSSYFDHLGYVDLSKTFLREIRDEQLNENMIDGYRKIEQVSAIDEESLSIRQKIRKYLLNGDVDSAIKLTELRFPSVFTQNEKVLFKLNCNKFIQLIKQSKIDEAIEFGQELRLKYSSNARFQEHLNDIFSLIAFENPKESGFGFLLEDDELLKVFDDLNSEILKSLGKSSISDLEKLVKTDKGLIQYLNKKNQQDSLLITTQDFGL